MEDDRDPKALTLYEAWAQLGYRAWRLIEAMFSWQPTIRRSAERRWTVTLANAVELRAELVGREQASRDYFGEPRWMSDERDWPAHLREDAPYLVCDRCGRRSWNPHAAGAEDRMTQPDGNPCGGTFVDPEGDR